MIVKRLRRDFQEKVLKPHVLLPFFVIVFIMFFLVLPNWRSYRDMFFIALFFVLGSLSYVYRRFVSIRFGFEFISVGTFLCTLAYGPSVGFFLGNATSFLAEIIGAKIDERIIINLLSINAVVLIVPFVRGLANSGDTGLLIASLLANAAYNVVGVAGNMILGGNPGKTIIFVGTNVFWTFAFFLRIGPVVYFAMVS